MSARNFQAALARLVAEPDFREAVRAEGEGALDGLDALERRRLLAVAGGRGLDMTCKVHRAWRLGKLYTMVPLTCVLVGEERLEREVHEFWRSRVPHSFYFRDEAFEFCDHLAGRMRAGMRVAYLGEVLAFERAVLELRKPFTGDEARRTRSVHFRHDPGRLLGPLREGRRPRGIPERPCVLVGTAMPDAPLAWELRSRSPSRGGGQGEQHARGGGEYGSVEIGERVAAVGSH